MTIKYFVWIFFNGIIGCMESKATSSSNLKQLKKGIYEENLAPYRMEYFKSPKAIKKGPSLPLICPLDQTSCLMERLTQRKLAYKQANSLKGYTIQLYMGSSRTAALKAQESVATFAYPATLHYRQPHYTVQLGFFGDRLEAYFVYLTLVKKIPSVIIRPSIRSIVD
ncbi:Sporulation domain-containing protein [Cardinium endosymbiont cBtQ1 of Bemisia tabaci]|nr:Sporulation domain-containing protein [Cardinium endosymbiont cBtQ1 of Bemisia tabaci]